MYTKSLMFKIPQSKTWMSSLDEIESVSKKKKVDITAPVIEVRDFRANRSYGKISIHAARVKYSGC